MPYITIQTTVKADSPAEFCKKVSALTAKLLGKPESYVQVAISKPEAMTFGGTTDPAAFLEVKSIGLPEGSTRVISEKLCALVEDELGIPQNRIYIEFANAQGHMWGWDGKTF
ncbi:MAG: phenylpyruvate tautomerase MIF-related protein [Spirochaetia bacterium]